MCTKIRMMGRWNCSVVIHYTRSAPISNIAADYRLAMSSREPLAKALAIMIANRDTSTNKIKAFVEKKAAGLRQEMKTVSEKLANVDAKASPSYVFNRKTKKLHRILASFADAGPDAMTNCGFYFARPGAQTSFHPTAPVDTKWEEVCSTCLPALRATLKG